MRKPGAFLSFLPLMLGGMSKPFSGVTNTAPDTTVQDYLKRRKRTEEEYIRIKELKSVLSASQRQRIIQKFEQ